MSEIQVWLDEGRALADQATQGPWEADGCEVTQHWSRPEPWQTIVDTEVSCMDYCYGGSAKGVERDEDVEFIADARTRLPQALNALQAVLEIHQDHGGPCSTVQAIQNALKGEHDDSYTLD